MQESLEASLVRIRTADGRVVGAGFLVGERHILTCAHVIRQALGLPNTPVDPPQATISLDFPLIAPRTPLTASVVQWYPPLSDGRGDMAGLELLGEPPATAEVVRFAEASDLWEHPFRAFGFPAGYDDGVWATGRLLGRQATDWVMIEDIKAQGHPVAAGFSGTPVWDTRLQGVVGMVVAASSLTDLKTAFVLPQDVLSATWPRLSIPLGQPRNPYKGLQPFKERDAKDFFGREAVVEKGVELVNALVAEQSARSSTRMLTILGPSGAGKSSLIMAGLLPQLQQGALHMLDTSAFYSSKQWVFLNPITPGKHPLEALASILRPHFPDTSFKTLREDLEDDSARGLHLLATQLAKQPGTSVVLLIDQGEELFTQTETEDERQRFLRLLLTACSEPRGPLLVLLTLRADFYDRPMQYPELYRLIETQHLSLLAIEPDDLRRVIEQPAALADVQLTFEGDLVHLLLTDVQGQVGALPLLQFTLDQLFQRRSGRQLTLSAYRELGGVKGALTRQAEETYTTLPSDEHRKLARALFVRLIDPGATEQDTTRRRAALSEFSLPEASQQRIMRETIDAFIVARLLTANEIAGTTTIEVSHEALIREWPRLAGWMREARNDIRLQQTISKDAADWEQRGKPRDRLYRGSQLKEAQAWVDRNIPSEDEVAFLRAGAARRVRLRVGIMGIILLVLLLSIPTGILVRSSFLSNVVTNLNDDGPGSLRQIIAAAKPGDTITFDMSVSGEVMLTSADLAINKNLTIVGPGASILAISTGHTNYRIHVIKGFSVTISGLSFKDSIIDNSKQISLFGNDPGPLLNEGTLTLKNSIISHNQSNGGGGGITNHGILTLFDSTVSDNEVGATENQLGGGGGIYNDGTLTLINSTVWHNTAGGDGGGIYNCYYHLSSDECRQGTLTLINSTVWHNTAGGDGGGIYNQGTTTITSSTISGNNATSGGDIYNGGSDMPASSQLRIRNSIVGGDPAHPGPDIGGEVLTSYGYNLFQDNSGATFDPATSSLHHTIDKLLSVNSLTKLFVSPVGLRDNGGPTKTLKLAPGSSNPAIDRIPLNDCNITVSMTNVFGTPIGPFTITRDQRGMDRPDDSESACDIGAYESS